MNGFREIYRKKSSLNECYQIFTLHLMNETRHLLHLSYDTLHLFYCDYKKGILFFLSLQQYLNSSDLSDYNVALFFCFYLQLSLDIYPLHLTL